MHKQRQPSAPTPINAAVEAAVAHMARSIATRYPEADRPDGGAQVPVREQASGAPDAGWLGPLQCTSTAANDAKVTLEEGDDGESDLRQDRQLVRTVIASRFIQARELNGLSQTEGAHALGYAKSGQLSLIESGRKSPPLAVLVKASDAYSVSVDYLLGVSSEPDRDVRAARRVAMRAFVASAVRGVADVLADVGENLVDAHTADVAPLAAAADRVSQAFAKVSIRPEFLEIRGGAKLALEVREMEAALAPVIRDLRRCHALDAELHQRIAEARQHKV